MTSELVARCIEIIAPSSDMELLCQVAVWQSFDELKSMLSYPERFGEPVKLDGPTRRERMDVLRALKTTVALMADHVWICEAALDRYEVPTNRATTTEGAGRYPAEVEEQVRRIDEYLTASSAAWQEWTRVSEYLTSMIAAAERDLASSKVRTRPPDLLKMYCAMCAFRHLDVFSRHRPKLSTDSAYYQLASVLYEAATGVPNGSVERQCNWFFRRMHRPGPSPH